MRGRPFLARAGVLALATLALLAALYAFRAPLLRGAAAVLVREDQLRPAAAIVVLGGEAPFRHLEAADLYGAGWAPRVVLSRERETESMKALAALGIHQPSNWELGRQALLRRGVPAEAIVTLPRPAAATVDELQQVFEVIRPDGRPVVLITTTVHSRRVGLIWDRIGGRTSPALVRPSSYDPFQPSAWWLRRADTLALTREYLSLANELLGRPARDRVPVDGTATGPPENPR